MAQVLAQVLYAKVKVSRITTNPISPNLYAGHINDFRPCISKEFTDSSDALLFQQRYEELSRFPNIPNVLPGGNSEMPLLLEKHVVMDVPYYSVSLFFNNMCNAYKQTRDFPGSFFEYIKHDFEQIYFGAIAGVRELLKSGYVPRDFETDTTVAYHGTDKDGKAIYRVLFLNVVPKTDDLTIQLIKDIRDSMRATIGLSGAPYDSVEQIRDGVPIAIRNFLLNATDAYLEFMVPKDADYVLNDPMTWSYEYIVIRNWFVFMFLEDYKDSDNSEEMSSYYQCLGLGWKELIEPGSFFDQALRHHARENGVTKAKLNFGVAVLEQEEEKLRYGGGRTKTMEELLEDYYYEFDKESNKGGLDTYSHKEGGKCVPKIKRNGSNHYNQNAASLGYALKTLKEIVEKVETEIYPCSSLFWDFNNLWEKKSIKNWEYHKAMIKGEKCWQDKLDQDRLDQNLKAKEQKAKDADQKSKDEHYNIEPMRRREDNERRRKDEDNERRSEEDAQMRREDARRRRDDDAQSRREDARRRREDDLQRRREDARRRRDDDIQRRRDDARRRRDDDARRRREYARGRREDEERRQ